MTDVVSLRIVDDSIRRGPGTAGRIYAKNSIRAVRQQPFDKRHFMAPRFEVITAGSTRYRDPSGGHDRPGSVLQCSSSPVAGCSPFPPVLCVDWVNPRSSESGRRRSGKTRPTASSGACGLESTVGGRREAGRRCLDKHRPTSRFLPATKPNPGGLKGRGTLGEPRRSRRPAPRAREGNALPVKQAEREPAAPSSSRRRAPTTARDRRSLGPLARRRRARTLQRTQ